jgi:hypothetical protein
VRLYKNERARRRAMQRESKQRRTEFARKCGRDRARKSERLETCNMSGKSKREHEG